MDPFDTILAEIKERMELLGENVSGGACTSFEDYKHRCGEIRGLKTAASYIIDLKRKMEHDDD